jgi:hypothetical protein
LLSLYSQAIAVKELSTIFLGFIGWRLFFCDWLATNFLGFGDYFFNFHCRLFWPLPLVWESQQIFPFRKVKTLIKKSIMIRFANHLQKTDKFCEKFVQTMMSYRLGCCCENNWINMCCWHFSPFYEGTNFYLK